MTRANLCVLHLVEEEVHQKALAGSHGAVKVNVFRSRVFLSRLSRETREPAASRLGLDRPLFEPVEHFLQLCQS